MNGSLVAVSEPVRALPAFASIPEMVANRRTQHSPVPGGNAASDPASVMPPVDETESSRLSQDVEADLGPAGMVPAIPALTRKRRGRRACETTPEIYDPIQVGRTLREALGASIFDKRFGRDGEPIERIRQTFSELDAANTSVTAADKTGDSQEELGFLAFATCERADEVIDTSHLGDEARLRADTLLAMTRDARGPTRPLIIATERMRRDLAKLADDMPNFMIFLSFLDARLALSSRTRSPLLVPPVFLIGPPGVGKTRLMKRLAVILGTSVHELPMSAETDLRVALSGLRPSWKNSRQGLVSKALIESKTASPLIILDEIEKTEKYHNGSAHPLDVLHGLFESENSVSFRDTYLEIDFRADNILWFASGNSTNDIPSSILDRMTILPVRPPSEREMIGIVDGIYREANERVGRRFPRHLPREVMSLLIDQTPRVITRLIPNAMGFAAQDDQSAISLVDVEMALLLVAKGQGETPRPIGFLPSSSSR